MLKLGRGKDVDLLTITLSSHDYLGHNLGANSPFMKDMAVAEDKIIADFIRTVSKEMNGLEDVFFVLTGDHGVPPTFCQACPKIKFQMEYFRSRL